MVVASVAFWWLTEVGVAESAKCAIVASGTMGLAATLIALPVEASRRGSSGAAGAPLLAGAPPAELVAGVELAAVARLVDEEGPADRPRLPEPELPEPALETGIGGLVELVVLGAAAVVRPPLGVEASPPAGMA